MLNQDDINTLRQARDAVLYGGKVSPLIEWTLSDAWTTPTEYNHELTEISGEIEAR